jgi:hypothetical protein
MGVALLAAGIAPAAGAAAANSRVSRHVLVLSIDGLHQSDLAYYVKAHPSSALASLVRSGTEYTNAKTTFPSDSFPGMVAQFTGGGPATTGIFYDDTWNRQLLPGGTLDCRTAAPGAEVSFTEAADRSQNPITLDAGQGLTSSVLTSLPTNTVDQTLALKDPKPGTPGPLSSAILKMTPTPQSLLVPAALPVNATSCQTVYPHNYLRVNTVFEVARSHGLVTAWSDKHPAYEILNGPSGTGIQDLFTPEINSAADSTGDDWSTDNLLTQEYDSTKVDAVLNEIAGKDHSGGRKVGTPAIFGMNFQSVSTAEKLPTSDGLTGGYLANGTPGPLLSNALNFVDAELGAMQTAIRAHGLSSSTTIILSAKHGQSPEDLASLRRVDDGKIIDGLNAQWAASHPNAAPLVSFSVDDDGMLLWLSDRSTAALATAKQYLLTHSAPANRSGDPKGTFSTTVSHSGLTAVYTGTAADRLIGAKPGDAHVPDLIGIAQQGVVYTGKTGKIAEHGGDHPEDLDVPLVVSGAGVSHGTSRAAVKTTQIAPTILHLLGLDPRALQAVRIEHTKVLPNS